MDPFSIALAMSLMLGGTYFKSQGLQKISDQQQQLAAQEHLRQSGLDQQRVAAVEGALPKLGPGGQTADQHSIAQKLAAYYTPPASSAPADYQAQSPGAPQDIQDRKDAVVADAMSKGRDYASKLADMSSYNLLNFGNTQTMNRLGENVSNLTRSQVNSSQILPFELQAAQRAGAKDFMASDLLNGAASITSLSGVGKGGAAPAGGAAGGSGITVGTPSPGVRVTPADYGSMSLFSPSVGGQGLRVAGVPRIGS